MDCLCEVGLLFRGGPCHLRLREPNQTVIQVCRAIGYPYADGLLGFPLYVVARQVCVDQVHDTGLLLLIVAIDAANAIRQVRE